MATKFPFSDNRVVTRGGRRRGVALISVISVLVLLTIVATPFLLTMRDSAQRGERFLYGARADAEAESLFETVRTSLVRSVEDVERRRLDATGADATGAERPADDATPTSDTLAEFRVPDSVLARFNRVVAREHRVWDVDVVDAQSLFDLNSCSFPVLANVLGRAELADDLAADATAIPLTNVSGSLPQEGGVVRLGNEAIRYERFDPRSSELVGCERGYRGDLPLNGGAREWQKGDVLYSEAAFQLATRPFRAQPGAWLRYTNPYEARTIAALGVTALAPEQFDALRRHVTCWAGNVAGDGWSDPQLVRNAISAGGETDLVAQVKNLRYYGPGTVVMLTDGVNRDYAVVTKVRGSNQVELAGEIRHDYAADQAFLLSLARAPLNVNTAPYEQLVLALDGLKFRGRQGLTRQQAEGLARFLKDWQTPGETEPGVFRTWEDFTAALDAARDDRGLLDQYTHAAVLANAMNANDSRLGFSTVPFVFRSFDLYEVRATASILTPTGRELARRELRRVMSISTSRSATSVVETQSDFQDQIMKSRDGKWFATFPKNVNAYYDGAAIPASELQAFAQKARFPSTSREATEGHVQLLPGAFRAVGRTDRFIHFDEQDTPDGIDLDEQSLDVGVDAPYSTTERKADLVGFVTVNGIGEDVETGLKPFACSFWYKPHWDVGGAEQILFDYGLEDPHMLRISLRYDPELGGLVLACADGTREQRSAEIVYPLDSDSPTRWEADKWYHIAFAIHGCSPDRMSLFVDGEQAGQASHLTRLEGSIPPTGDVQDLPVEEASTFPPRGVLILHGEEGMELMEYESRSDRGFRIRRRRARNIDSTLDPQQAAPRTHNSGATVQLYGFSAPLGCDIKRGGLTLQSQIGPFRAYRFYYKGDLLQIQPPVQGGGGGPPPGAVPICRGLANPASPTFPIADIQLADWDTGSQDANVMDDLGAVGAQGIAMIVSKVGGGLPDGTTQIGPDSVNGQPLEEQSRQLGGMEIVAYRVTGTGTVEITARNLDLRHTGTDQADPPRFLPTYSYGDPAPTPGQPENPVPQFEDDDIIGFYTAFIPLSIAASGSGDYIDPDDESQLPGGAERHAYIQIDGEWVKYDTFDTLTLPGVPLFYRDVRMRNVAGLWGAGFETFSAQIAQSEGQPGGGGSPGSSTEPPFAEDLNREDQGPEDPTGSDPVGYEPPPITSLQIAEEADFRSFENRTNQWMHRIANTVPTDHAQNTQILPTFYVVPGWTFDSSAAGAGAYPGFQDLLTLRDYRGSDEQVRVQWGYQQWVGLTRPTIQRWGWDRFTYADLRRFDPRLFTRVVKFPSGEMPDSLLTANTESLLFGRRFDDAGAQGSATIDELGFAELRFPSPDRVDFVYLGEVPGLLTNPTGQAPTTGGPAQIRYEGIDEETDEIPIFMPYYDPATLAYVVSGVPIHEDVFPEDGGVAQIGDELILYSGIDLERGVLTGCFRGAFNTHPKSHPYGVVVRPVESFPASRLVSDADAQAASFQLAETRDFPDDGYLRLGNAGEIVGYTEWTDGELSGPLGRIDEEDPASRRPFRGGSTSDTEARVGGGLFRGRFGTTPEAYVVDDVAIAMPFRHYDRYAERADHPEMSYVKFAWNREGAIWKRVSWDEQPVENVEVLAVVRFAGGPPWDSDELVRVGQDPIPETDRHRKLYEIADPGQLNLLNVESDRIEVRFYVRFAQGAYDRFAEEAPNEWKETPWVKKVVVEYVAPPQTLYQE